MPLQSESQLTGYEGERWFRSALPRGWIPQRPETDVGIDFLVVISEDGDLDKREFHVQVKSSRSMRIQNGSVILRHIKRSTLDYWFLSPLPTLIVAYDEQANRGYFRWHSELVNEIQKPPSETLKKISIAVPIVNELNDDGWRMIRENLLWHYRNLSASLANARDTRSLLPVIHDLAASARQLSSIDHQPIAPADRTEQQEGLLALYELTQYRLAVTSLCGLRNELLPGSEGEIRLSNWISAFESRVLHVFPTFLELTDWGEVPGDFQITYARNLIHQQRPRMIEVILEMIMLLAPGRFNRKD